MIAMSRFALAMAVILTAGAASAASAPRKSDATPKIMALDICKRCHNTAPDAKASDPGPPGVAPAFTVIAAKPTTTRASLVKLLRLPHGEMDTVALARKEAEQLADYILSLRPAAAK